MSLACAWAGIPGVIAYKAHPLTYLLGKLLVKVSYLGMANLLLPDNPPNAEFLQGEAKGSKIANGLEFLLDDSSSGKRAEATAGMLQKMLSEGEQKTVVEWLLQAGKLA